MSGHFFVRRLRVQGLLETLTLNSEEFEGKVNSKDGTITVFDVENTRFEEGNIIERPLVQDLKEYYVVKEVNLSKGIPPHTPAKWMLSVSKQGKEVKIPEAPTVHQTFVTTVNGDIKGGQMIGTTDSTQNVNYTESGENISKVLDNLFKMVQDSNLNELEKDDVEEILNRLSKFSQMENKSTILTRAKERLGSLKGIITTGISTGKLIPEAIELFSNIKSFFI